MTHTISVHDMLVCAGRFIGHAAAVVVGFVMMVVGLGLGVTVMMLPIGLVIGLAGLAVFIGGLFAHIDEPRTVRARARRMH